MQAANTIDATWVNLTFFCNCKLDYERSFCAKVGSNIAELAVNKTEQGGIALLFVAKVLLGIDLYK